MSLLSTFLPTGSGGGTTYNNIHEDGANVGIGSGVTTPTVPLQIENATAIVQVRSTTNGNDSTILMTAKGEGGTEYTRRIVHDPDADTLEFRRGDLEKDLVIHSSGKVGVGATTTPIGQLEVFGGSLVVAREDDKGVRFNVNGSTSPALTKNAGNQVILQCAEDSDIVFKTNATEKMILKNNGRLGINKSIPDYTFDMVGDARIVGNLYTTETTETVYTLTGTDIDPSNGSVQTKNLTTNTIFTASNFEAGQVVLIRINNGDTYTVTWPSMTWAGGSTPALTANDTVVMWKIGTDLYGSYLGTTVSA